MLKGSVIPNDKVFKKVEMRVQEMIYGHRFSTEQHPYMIILEVLGICNQYPLGKVPLDGKWQKDLLHAQRQAKKLRFLLFMDKSLTKVLKEDNLSKAEKWCKWKKLAHNQYLTMDKISTTNQKGGNEFNYLDTKFKNDIYSLKQAIDIVRSQELDVPNDRRWTSKFLAIGGPDMICGDLSLTGGSAGDRRFFARGGEVVYLMLNRSDKVTLVRDHIERVFLDPNDPMNRITKVLSDSKKEKSFEGSRIGYLPSPKHCMYDRMADDWISILSIRKLPQSHIFEPLFRLTGLNLVLYFAWRAAELKGEKEPTPIVADLMDGANTRLRDTAREYFLHHRVIADQAIVAYVKIILGETQWDLLDSRDSEDAYDIITKKFFYNGKLGNSADPLDQMNELIGQAKSRRRNNISKLLVPLSRSIGLIKRRPNAGTWFCLDDSMLVALALANVEGSSQVELGEFVRLLYDRYRLIIGPREAVRAFKDNLPIGIENFRNNLIAFEERMTRLSLTRRFSDDCAFVINPYGCHHDRRHR